MLYSGTDPEAFTTKYASTRRYKRAPNGCHAKSLRRVPLRLRGGFHLIQRPNQIYYAPTNFPPN